MARNHILGFAALSFVLSSCGSQQAAVPPPGPLPDNQQGPEAGYSEEEVSSPEVVTTTLADVGLDGAALDKTADPCGDFFQFACGGWLASTEMPSDRGRYGTFNEVSDRNLETLKKILETAAASKSADPATAAIGHYYGACMDEKAISKAGLSGIAPLLKAAKKVRNEKSLFAAVTTLHKHGIWPLFNIDPESDFKNSTMMILFVDQGGLGLPDRDYYLKTDKAMKDIRALYTKHVARMLELAGEKKSRARKAAKDILAIETALAKVSMSREDRRDPAAIYHKVDRAGLAKLAPDFPWDSYFAALGYPDLEDISVTVPDFFTSINDIYGHFSRRAWTAYLTWQVLNATAHTLPKKFVDEDFVLTSALTGAKTLRPRWKRCVSAVDGALGEYLGKPFIDEMFPGESKTAAKEMVAGIESAFRNVLVTDTEWMAPETKKQAMAKLAAMTDLIGYPDKWKTYDFSITPDNYAKNYVAAQAFELHRDLGKVGKPTDRSEWHMTPPTVNAYYNPPSNQMVFPAGILQPPFFGADRHIAANLGGIGMVVGHELTHAFDDTGAKFDKDGNLKNWWQPEDQTKFEAKGECVAKQYSAYEPVDGVHINGKLTLGENIADMGGVKLAYLAYRAMRAGADKVYVADGYNEDQQFFIAVGQAWCSKSRDADIRRRVVTDPHSPPHYRVLGALSNSPEFAKAFSCAEGTPMHPKNTCSVW